MSELEKYIRDKRESFDEAEPVEGHEQRFLQRLERNSEQKENRGIGFWKIAAAVVVLVAVGLSVLVPKFNGPEDVQYASMSLGDVSAEMAEVELYYKSELAEEYEKLNDLSKSDPEVAAHLSEIEELNKAYAELEEQLYESGNHDKVITAMIENFRLRLELLEKLEAKKGEIIKQDSL
ncbi:MAG: hypothetical protein ABR574_13625 [Cryomorphaceae bacterium]|nr:hypothetical protein [Flavobacteriales bacterium]